MTTDFIKLGDMNYDDIRNNIKSFMSSRSDLDFDFDGSIAGTMLDLLAYNTLYYAYYSNMMINESFIDSAQRIENLVSLVKPLGYVVEYMRSSIANIDINNSSIESNATLDPYTTVFTADVDGLQYNFFYVGNYSGEGETDDNQLVIPASSSKPNVTVYEGKSATIKSPISLDFNSQSANINEKKVDTRTLRVYVNENDGSVYQYTRRSNTNSSTSADERVYFLETTKDGYRISFGGFNDSNGTRVGRGVGATERVFVSYVVSSGSVGNSARRFTSALSGISITNDASSSGGYSSPNKDSIKFLATRDFTKNENPITVSDYQVAIRDLGIISTSDKGLENNISVYTSNKITDSGPGKILYSLLDEDGKRITNQPTVINQQLRDNVMVGLSLEYRKPTNVDMQFTMDGGDDAVSAFNGLYNRGGVVNTTGFNQTISAADIARASDQTGSWKSVEVDVLPYNTDTTIAGIENKTIDLKNKLTTSELGTTLQFRGYALSPSFLISGGFSGSDNELYVHSSGIPSSVPVGTTLGTADMERGLIHFNFSSDAAARSFITGVSANFENKSLIYIKDEILATPRASK
jgi:hypothetical protein